MFIAREKNNDLYEYTHKPKLSCGFNKSFKKIEGERWRINPELHPEVTFENSPKQVHIIYNKY